MDLSLRSVLTAGAGVATATAIVMAPSVIPPTITSAAPAHARIVTPTELAANVTPITQELLQSVVAAINTVAPGLGVPAAPALAAAPEPLNATSDVINSVYSFTRYWANYATLDLTPWVLQFIPFGWVVTDQINIWYQPFVLRTTDAFVYDFLDPIVNNPLNLNVWINSGIALANAAALIADGLHARTDGFTSLAVLLGAGGVALGFPLADPIIGLAITIAILAVLRTAVRDVFRRLLDAVDPDLVDAAEAALAAEPGVTAVRSVKMRWIGHRLHADAELDIDPATSLTEAHQIAHDAEHTLTHAVPKLSSALIHAYPSR